MAPPASAGPRAAGNTSAQKAEMQSCAMHDVSAIADVVVENTADGAVMRLKAKKAGDVKRVQEMASMMAEHMNGGCTGNCAMDRGGMMHGGMMQGGMQGSGSTTGMGGHAGMKDNRREPPPKPAAKPSNQKAR
jgi:hypothetical protein